MSPTRTHSPAARARQRGAIAIVVGISLTMLIGFAGLALDLGRLFANKSELQNAADACALAASNELVCDTSVTGTCPAAFLQRAEVAGTYVASRNKKNLQGSAVTIATGDVRFHTAIGPNASYQPRGSASANSKYVMCVANSTGIVPWFMGVLGAGPSSVSATAVATLAPSAAFCDPAPMGVCKPAGATAATVPPWGMIPNQWLKSAFAGPKDDIAAGGGFQWVDYSAVAGGVPDLREILAGTKHYCGVKVGDNVAENGAKTGTAEAYNTRFGLYKTTGGGPSTPTVLTAPPDRTGYAYPTASFPYTTGGLPASGQVSAYPDYRTKQGTATAYSATDYPPAGLKTPKDIPSPSTDHATFGLQRRVVSTPIIECGASAPTILAMGCVLMLNPMGTQGSGASDIFLQYLGLATSPSSPCRTAGVAGAGGGSGPLTPTLVQ